MPSLAVSVLLLALGRPAGSPPSRRVGVPRRQSILLGGSVSAELALAERLELANGQIRICTHGPAGFPAGDALLVDLARRRRVSVERLVTLLGPKIRDLVRLEAGPAVAGERNDLAVADTALLRAAQVRAQVGARAAGGPPHDAVLAALALAGGVVELRRPPNRAADLVAGLPPLVGSVIEVVATRLAPGPFTATHAPVEAAQSR